MRRKKSRRFRLHFFVSAAVFCLIAGLVVLFASGPVQVPFLGSLLSYQGTRGPVQLSIARASVDFTADAGINIIVEDAKAEISGDSPVSISLPKLIAPLNRGALFSGKFHFASLNLDKPHVQIDLKGGSAKVPEIGPLMEAVDRVSDVVDDQFARRGLRFVRILNGSIDITGSHPRRFERIDTDILRSDNRVIRALARVTGNVTTWRLELVRSAPEGAAQKKIGLVVNGITLAELLGQDAVNKQGKGLGLPASAKIESTLDADGGFISANAVARMQDGWFQMGRTLVAFDDAALSLLFKTGQEAIEITRSHIIRGDTRLFFTGSVKPGANDQNWNITLETKHPQFGSSDVSEEPHMLDGVHVKARFDFNERLLSIDEFTARSGKAVVNGIALLQLTPEGPYLALAADGEQIPVAVVKQLWPITLVPPARRWVIDNIKRGLIEEVSYTVAIRPPAFNHRDPDPGWSGNDMRLDMTFSDAAVTPFGDIPEIRGMEGTLTVGDETLTIVATDGSATASNGGEVSLPTGTFQIFDLPLRNGKTAKVTTQLRGTAADLGAVANSAPFSVLDRAGLKNSGVSGSGSLDVEAEFPLGKKIDVTEIDWQATGEMENFSDKDPIMGHTIANADITIEANPKQAAITGKGKLDGLQADIDLVVPLGGSGVAPKQDVVVSITAEQMKDKGVDLTSFLDGGMTLSVARATDGQEFKIDLEQTDIRLQALGWQKAKGVPATASFKLVETEIDRRIEDFSLVSEGVDVAGSMLLTEAGDLVSASFDTFKLRPGDDVEVDIQRASDGRYDIIFSGSAFDGRGLIRSVRSPGGSKGEGDFSEGSRISATIDRVTGFNNRTLARFSGQIETGERGLVSADLRGQIDGRSDFVFKIVDQYESQLAIGNFADTGATLQFLDIYKRMRGGAGSLSVAMADENSWVGEFKAHSLQITEDPAIKRIRERDRQNLEQSNPIPPASRVNGSANFDTLEINFAREGDNLTISRGALRGNVLGGTFSGTVDLKQQTLNLTGTFIPIYALNNFFAKIPLLGFALGGSSGEGLIGVTYRLHGSVSDPTLSVNPISAIAPGIFRKMFEFQAN